MSMSAYAAMQVGRKGHNSWASVQITSQYGISGNKYKIGNNKFNQQTSQF